MSALSRLQLISLLSCYSFPAGGKEGSQQLGKATGSLVSTSQVKSQPSAEDHGSNSEQEDEGEKLLFRSPIRQLVKGQTIEDDYAGLD